MSEKARAHLLEAFWTLYQGQRLDRITVKEVAAKAGYNRSTFYEHFDRVEDCLEELEQRCLPGLDDLPFATSGSAVPGNTEPSADFLRDFVALYELKAPYFNVLLGDRGDPAFRRRLIDTIKAAVTHAPPTALGVQLPADHLERDLWLEYRIAGLLGVLSYANGPGSSVAKEALARAIFRVVS